MTTADTIAMLTLLLVILQLVFAIGVWYGHLRGWMAGIDRRVAAIERRLNIRDTPEAPVGRAVEV